MRRTLVILLGLFAIALLFRLPDLGASCNIDGVQHWFARTRRFWEALHDGRLKDTYYSPHPGVSLMWLSGLSMQAYGVLGVVSERAVVAATLPIALLSASVSPLSYWLLQRMLPSRAELPRFIDVPLVAACLLATEPFLIGHARTFHMDSLMTGFVWVALLFAALALIERKKRWAVLAGVGLGLALLTRMVAGVFALSLAIPFAFAFARERRPRTKTLPLLLAIAAGTTAAITFLGWPALLLEPVTTLRGVFGWTTRLIEKGHSTFSWGRIYAHDPGIKFYLGSLLMRLTPEVLLGALLLPLIAWRASRRILVLTGILVASYLPFTLAVLFGSKKADRYLLFLFPLLLLFASITAIELLRFVQQRGWLRSHGKSVVLAALALLLVVRGARLAHAHPMPITWCATYPGLQCENVITLGAGEGFRDVALWIRRHSRVKPPKVSSAYGAGNAMRPWLNFTSVKPANAHFIVTYIASDQRGRDQHLLDYVVGEPLHEVAYGGRVYAKIYRGPRYRETRK